MSFWQIYRPQGACPQLSKMPVAKTQPPLITSAMKLNSVRAIVCLISLSSLLSEPTFSQELKIDRKERLVSYLQDSKELLKRWRKVEGKLYKATFVVPPSFMSVGRPGLVADPFADSPVKETRQLTDQQAQQILEEAGITFGKGAKVHYDKSASILTVVQTPDQLELCEAYLGIHYCGYQSEIPIRVEIYELSMTHAQELLESCEGQSDHTAERNAVRQLVKEGGAKLIALPSVISRSGQRSKIVDAYEIPYLEQVGIKSENGEEKPKQESMFGSRPVGTILEVDPVLGADNWTIDLNFTLEHHTAPPEHISVSKGIEMPVFHSKEITTQLSLLKGSYILVGSWKPTGKQEYDKNDLMQVVFLTANVQSTRNYGVLQPDEDEKSNSKK